jgi:hypothetical protein
LEGEISCLKTERETTDGHKAKTPKPSSISSMSARETLLMAALAEHQIEARTTNYWLSCNIVVISIFSRVVEQQKNICVHAVTGLSILKLVLIQGNVGQIEHFKGNVHLS